jgi:hypothetical protein
MHLSRRENRYVYYLLGLTIVYLAVFVVRGFVVRSDTDGPILSIIIAAGIGVISVPILLMFSYCGGQMLFPLFHRLFGAQNYFASGWIFYQFFCWGLIVAGTIEAIKKL